MNLVEGHLENTGFHSEDGEIVLTFDPAAIDLEEGHDVTLGVRPEDVYPVDQRDTLSSPSNPIETTTDVLEPMGDKIFIYLLMDEGAETNLDDPDAGGQLLMSVDPGSDIEPDTALGVMFDRSNVHLFDSETGEAILHDLTALESDSTRPEPTETELEGDD
jgi:multiple sugar transport system ATP-binding protein